MQGMRVPARSRASEQYVGSLLMLGSLLRARYSIDIVIVAVLVLMDEWTGGTDVSETITQRTVAWREQKPRARESSRSLCCFEVTFASTWERE
jgi:hypothetical protein